MSEPPWSRDDDGRKRGRGGLLNGFYPLIVAAICLVVANYVFKLHMEQQFGDELRSLKDMLLSHLRNALP